MSQSARVSELVFDPKLRHLLSLKKILFEQNPKVQQVTSNNKPSIRPYRALVHSSSHTQHSPSFTCNHSPKGVACPTYRFYFPINTKRDRMSLSNGQQSCFFIGRFRGQMWARRPVILAENSCDILQPSQANNRMVGPTSNSATTTTPLLSLTHTHTHTHTQTQK